ALLLAPADAWLGAGPPADDPWQWFLSRVPPFWRAGGPRQARSRRAPRVTGSWPATVNGAPGRAVAVSPSGMRVATTGRFEAGASVEVALALAGVQQVRGRVQRCDGRTIDPALDWPHDAGPQPIPPDPLDP